MLNKANLKLKAFGILNAPLIGFANPSIVKIDDNEAVVKMPLNWRTVRRDLKSMYLGALVIGADIASGIMAFSLADSSPHKFSLVFKDIHSDFLKRPESDVYFTCRQGQAIRELMDKAAQSRVRESILLEVVATCPKKFGDEPVAKFQLTLAVKAKS